MDSEKLREGKRVMAERCASFAASCTPVGLVIEYRKGLTGRAWKKETRISVPHPVTRKSLYIYLHEIAHIVNDERMQPRHVQEMNAEKWAHQKMREGGFSVPRSMTKRAKQYVAWKIEQAQKRGAKHISHEALIYAKQ